MYVAPGTSGVNTAENLRHRDMKQCWSQLSKTHGLVDEMVMGVGSESREYSDVWGRL